MRAYFIMPAFNSTTGGPMGMFKNSTKETKEFEKILEKKNIKIPVNKDLDFSCFFQV